MRRTAPTTACRPCWWCCPAASTKSRRSSRRAGPTGSPSSSAEEGPASPAKPAGIGQRRSIPRFADPTFKRWFRSRERRDGGGAPVLLWPDTFTNHFHPEIGVAAVEVLEALGFQVLVPDLALCCGRPLYDYGMLRSARRLLEDILDALGPAIDEGIPLVGLEPSCLAVFRDELHGLFPSDERARRLREQSYVFSEFVQKFAPDFSFPALHLRAVVQTHCHHHAVMGFRDEEALLRRLGVDADVLRSGCCGMAGSFGFEEQKVDLSLRAAERVLLPAVREADDALILADGFSCRTQIEQGTGRRALHVAELARAALTRRRREALEGPMPPAS